jgi:glycerol-3-phosphate dehydrogenase (NAD(P)+)
LAEAVSGADIIIFCLPVMAHPGVIEQIKPALNPQTLCVSIAKGLDEQGRTAAQIFQQQLSKDQHFGLIYGPMISEEIVASRYAFADVATRFDNDADDLMQVFRGSRLFLRQKSDITGASWAVILKNVYAMAFGIADELQLGDNVRGYLATESTRELHDIVMEMGGQGEAVYGLAGLADLITTATSEDSHHHTLGRQLARGETENISGEGVHTLAMVEQYKLFKYNNYPLFTLMAQLIKQPQNIEQAFEHYLLGVTSS